VFIVHLFNLFLSLTSNVYLIFILVWAAQAGAKRVYAIEYTDMAKHARRVVKANNVDHIVTVIQSAVEDVILPQEDWDGINNNHDDNSNIERGLGGLTLEEGDVEVNVNGKKNQRVVDIILSGKLLLSNFCSYECYLYTHFYMGSKC
jgi:homoserine trans-succinylase